jgi:thiamine biosynthesis protein ThiS
MIKIKKIKIKLNGKIKTIKDNTKLSNLLENLKIPIKKVAIEINQNIVDKKKLSKINLKNNDKVEIVHFIGGG